MFILAKPTKFYVVAINIPQLVELELDHDIIAII